MKANCCLFLYFFHAKSGLIVEEPVRYSKGCTDFLFLSDSSSVFIIERANVHDISQYFYITILTQTLEFGTDKKYLARERGLNGGV
jgi:hypothetical protein